MKQRLSLKIYGAVQGIGFRPFVYQLATNLKLTGRVNNSSEGVMITVEGDRPVLESFLSRLVQEKPTLAQIQELQSFWGDAIGYKKFQIKASTGGEKTALILPDIATCPQCQQEIFDPNNRRYRYPFTNCTNCGSRFSIIETLPYDRPNTTMKHFAMGDRCLTEYQDPLNRRFHAQPNACPECGPHLELWDQTGKILASHHDALLAIARAIRQGKIVAIKGLGGFHLVVDANNAAAVRQLRDRKHRPDKPFALMYPNLELVKVHCQVSALEEKLLLSPQAPIVLLTSLITNPLSLHTVINNSPCSLIAPNNSSLGVMLPYTPLHHLLTRELGFPLVATSGNLRGEPICIDNQEALEKLNQIADLFLVHNRPIARPLDDSIVRVVAGRTQMLRRARGYAPLPILSSCFKCERGDRQLPTLLAVGGQSKNAIAFLKENNRNNKREQTLFLSQYIGDLETIDTFERFQQTIDDLQELYELKPTKVICDQHPHYLATNYAQQSNLPMISVQHHYAHVLSCMADNEIDLNEPVLGVAWDGTGYGLDSTIWGGEFLQITPAGFERVAHLRTFSLPGGERAIKEPARIAIALLYEIFGDQLFTERENFDYLSCIRTFSGNELSIIHTMLKQNINTPITSSMGRLFDAIAAIVGIRQRISYEGQAAGELEFAISNIATDEIYKIYNFELIEPPKTSNKSPLVIDWAKIVTGILLDINHQVSPAEISAKFHHTLIEIIIAVARRVGRKQIILTGGCWQNKYLMERAIACLKAEKFIPYWHHRLPCNDSGIAVGQIAAAYKQSKF